MPSLWVTCHGFQLRILRGTCCGFTDCGALTSGKFRAETVVHTLVLFYFKLEDNYNIVMVSAIHQHESAISIHMSPPS